MIADGTIVNADVNAGAAIDGTKISPNFGSQTITTTGVVSAALGAAATPSITFTGDLNTGIYSPGADQVAVATNGVGRLFVSSSGRLGIGTSSATARMTIGDGNVYFTNSSSSASTVREVFNYINPSASVASSNGLSVGFRQSDIFPNRGASVRFIQTGNSDGGGDASTAIGFWTYNLGYDNGVERMRLTSTGLGIGTTSPSQALHVVGTVQAASTSSTASSNVGLRLSNSGDGTLFNGISFQGNYFSDLYFGRSGGADDLVVRNGSSELLRIQNGGRLLVGTSTSTSTANVGANQNIQVQGSSSLANVSVIGNAASSIGGYLTLAKSRSTAAGGFTVVTQGDELGAISFEGADGSAYRVGASIGCVVDGTPGSNDMPGRLVFSTTADGASSPTERMRITNGGTIMVNTTSNDPVGTSVSQSLACGPGASDGAFNYYNASAQCLKIGRGNNGDIITFFRNQPSATVVGSVSVTTTATAYNTSSDYRLKENVVAVTDGIARLQQLKPSRFNFIADPSKTVDGFLAHEAAEVVPECVTGEKDAVDDDGNPIYQGIDQSKLVPLLTAALQEAIGEIKSLKARVVALESA
jgi:hypothetical protein